MNADPALDDRILVMGVGRSGTTALYGLLQHILEDRYPGDVDYVYEPFLWDRKTFNKPYKQLTDEFRYAASVSIDGMYHHKQLPILVGNDFVISQPSKNWLAKTLSPTDGKRHYLGKLIRANGRVRLVRELVPTAKIIFVIRNPIDVLNSAAQLFSFYGSEFYESDFDRFADEVEQRFQETIKLSSEALCRIQAEYAYWHYSNLAFLEYSRAHPQNILNIAYEALIEGRVEVVRRICEFLEIDFQPNFAIVSKKRLGLVQQTVSGLSKAEFHFLYSKLDDYRKLLEFVRATPSAAIEELIKTASWNEGVQVWGNKQNVNALYARKELQKIENQRAQAVNELSVLRSSKRYRFINQVLRPLDQLNSHVRRRRVKLKRS